MQNYKVLNYLKKTFRVKVELSKTKIGQTVSYQWEKGERERETVKLESNGRKRLRYHLSFRTERDGDT